MMIENTNDLVLQFLEESASHNLSDWEKFMEQKYKQKLNNAGYKTYQLSDGRVMIYNPNDGTTKKAPTFEKLYRSIMTLTVTDAFEQFIANAESKNRNPKTIREWRNEFNRFYRDDNFSNLSIDKIKISDLCNFLDRCHVTPITKQRHDAIRTIYNKIVAYVNRYENMSVTNLFSAIDYTEWTYKSSNEKTVYTCDELNAISEYVLNLPNPTSAQLGIVVICNTGIRNSELRGLRFCDISDTAITVSGMAVGSQRVNRVKSDSTAGKRTIAINKYARTALKMASELSCSDTYVFTRKPADIVNNEVIITEQAVRRALMRICKVLGITYRNVHGIRFSVATALANADTSVYDLQSFLGHTTPTMSLHYVKNAENSKPNTAWTRLDKEICKSKNAPSTDLSVLEAL